MSSNVYISYFSLHKNNFNTKENPIKIAALCSLESVWKLVVSYRESADFLNSLAGVWVSTSWGRYDTVTREH